MANEIRKIIILATFAVFVVILFKPFSVRADDIYGFSMMPQFFPERMEQMTAPLVKYLEDGCRKKISNVSTKNNQEYESVIRKGSIDLAYQNPMVYNSISDIHEVIAVGVSHEGGDRYRGLIIVSSSSPLTSLKELRGKSVMIVGKSTGGGYLSPKITLLESGVDVEKDLELVTAADNKQENVIMAVSLGDVEAGFIRESAFHTADDYIKPGSVRILAQCAWLPGWAFSVRKSLPQNEKTRIRNLLVGLPVESPVIKALGLKGFREADDSVYAPLKKLSSQADVKSGEKNTSDANPHFQAK